MKIKTSELAGAALDWAVATCEGINVVAWNAKDRDAYFVVLEEAFEDKEPTTFYGDPDDTFYPSVNWAQGGPIIEQAEMEFNFDCHDGYGNLLPSDGKFRASCASHIQSDMVYSKGPTHLISAMRCYVASKMGDEVDVPEELK